MKIHKKKISENISLFVFSKSKNKCVEIRYDCRYDFGEKSSSGASFDEITIHNRNAVVLDDFEEITINEVPNSIINLLTFFKQLEK